MLLFIFNGVELVLIKDANCSTRCFLFSLSETCLKFSDTGDSSTMPNKIHNLYITNILGHSVPTYGSTFQFTVIFGQHVVDLKVYDLIF